MGDLAATLAAIDEVAVHTCGQCDQPLRDGAVSKYFCGDWCQTQWYERQADRLLAYREPTDLAVHVANLDETPSPECTPPRDCIWDLGPEIRVEWPTSGIHPDWRSVDQAFSDALFGFEEAIARLDRWHPTGMRSRFTVLDECRNFSAALRSLSPAPLPTVMKPWTKLPEWALEGCPVHECDQRGMTLSLLDGAEPVMAPLPAPVLAPVGGPERPRRTCG